MPANRLDHLFERYLSQGLTPEEHRELMQLLQQPARAAEVKALLDHVWQQLVVDKSLESDRADMLFQAILAADPQTPANNVHLKPVRRLSIVKWMAAAAAILILISTGWWFYYNKSKPVPSTSTLAVENDIPPGKNNAVLILADGRRINLDSTANGDVAKEGSTAIRKSNEQILYEVEGKQAGHSEITWNTVATARGNQYKLVLPDGSSIWLNAESSVRFPVAFNGKERRVEVTGEVYLQVKHNSAMPFTVVANGVEVRDLGTEFNVNAYANEDNIQTTVVEGSVSVNGQWSMVNKKPTVVTPGQQAVISSGAGAIQLIKDSDVDAAIAWKKGQFMFAGNNIQSVMRQLERWYDLEVTYAPNVTSEEFIGTITRYTNISAVLKMLERTGTVHFEVQGRKVFVK